MSIKPTIENGRVTHIEVGNTTLALKNEISLEELPTLIKAVEYLQQYIDFSKVSEEEIHRFTWSREEIFRFLSKRNSNQILFFYLLAENEEISREDVVREMGKELNRPDFSGLSLAGVLAGIGQRTNRLKKEVLYNKVRRRDDTYYKLNEDYENIIKEWLNSNYVVERAHAS